MSIIHRVSINYTHTSFEPITSIRPFIKTEVPKSREERTKIGKEKNKEF